MNPLPPQAYTKDTLLKAYSWLMTQGPSIKEMASTPDILVSLYLKAIRDGDSALDRPSIQNFKSELKSLAGLMGQLDKTGSSSGSGSNGSAHPSASSPPPHAPAYQSNSSNSSGPFSSTAHSAPAGATAHPRPPTPPSSMHSISGLPSQFDLDSASQAMIREVKIDFNLSSETEALRMLIKIGYSRCKTIL